MPSRKAQPTPRKSQSTARTTRATPARTTRASAPRRKAAGAPVVHVLGEVTEPTQIELTIVVEIRPSAGSAPAGAARGEAEHEYSEPEPPEPGQEDPRPGT